MLDQNNIKYRNRDQRTKTGWYRTERFDPGPRTGKIQEIYDQLGPGPRKNSDPGTRPDQNQQSCENLGPFGPGSLAVRGSPDTNLLFELSENADYSSGDWLNFVDDVTTKLNDNDDCSMTFETFTLTC